MAYLKLLIMAFILFASPAFADAIEGKKGPAEILAETTDEDWRTVGPAHLMIIELDRGRVTVELSGTFAQGHVTQMKTLVKAGFYDGLSFYRVIDGFVAQAGDVFETRELPEGTVRGLKAEFEEDVVKFPERVSFLSTHQNVQGTGTDGYTDITGHIDGFPVGFELNDTPNKNWLLHCTGAMAMARDTPKDTGGTEFYITLQPQRYLDRNLTVFGKVIDGMEHLQALKRQQPPESEEDPLGEIMNRVWMGDQPREGELSPQWQVLRTNTQLFSKYVESRRNRPEAFFYHRPDHIDVCQLPIPVRQKPEVNSD